MGKKYAFLGISIISFLMLGGATFGVAPTFDPALGDGNTLTVQNDFLPSAAGQSEEPEMITCNEMIPFYDYEEHGGWVENEDRALENRAMPVTIEKNQWYTKDVLWYQVEVDEDGMCIKVFDQEFLDNRQQYTTPDAVPAPLRVGEYQNYMIYQDPEDDIDTFTYETHAPYINDYGEWKPHIVYNEDDHVKVKFWNTDYVFDKASGAVTTFFMDELQIASDSYVIRTAELGTDDWSNLEINNAPIETTIEVIENSVTEEVLVTFTRTSEEGVYALEHKVYLGVGSPELKTTAYFTNAIYPNHKFAFTETVDLTSSIISVNEEEIDLANYVGQSFPRAVLEQHKTLIMQIQAIYFNAFLGFDNLWSVNIITPTKVSLDYANVGSTQTAIGETHELDPIWGALGYSDPVANYGQCYWSGCGTLNAIKIYIYSYNSTWNAQGSCLATGHFTQGGGNWGSSGPAWFTLEGYHAISMGDNTCATTSLEWDVEDLRGATVQDVWVSHFHNIWSLGAGQMESWWTDHPNTLRLANYPNQGVWGGCADLTLCPITPSDLWDTSLGINWNGNYARDGVAPNADVFGYESQTQTHYDFNAQATTDFNANLQLPDCVNNSDCFFNASWHPNGFPTKVCSTNAAPSCSGGDSDYYSGTTKLGVKFTLPPEDPTALAAVQTTGGQADLTWLSNWQDAPALDSIGNSEYFISNVAHPNTDFTGGGTQFTGSCSASGLPGPFGPPTTPTYGVPGAHGKALWFDGVCDYIGQNANGDLLQPSTKDANGVDTNNYSLNVWIKMDCPTAKEINGFVNGITTRCGSVPMGQYMTQNFGYILQNNQWGVGNGNYYDDNVVSVNGLYSDEHVVAAWNQAGTSMGGIHTGFCPSGSPAGCRDAGSTHAGQWYMFTMTVDGAKDTHFYVNGNEIRLWSYPGSCQGGTTLLAAYPQYGFGTGPGIDKTASYSGCANSVQTNVGSTAGGNFAAMTIGAAWHSPGATTYPFLGKIDELTTWNKILTQADITALHGTSISMGNPAGGTGTHCTWSCTNGWAAYPSVVANWDDHLVNYLPFEETGNPTKNHAVKPGSNPNAETFTIQRDNVTIATGVPDKFYDDAGLTAGTTYVYKVLAVSSTGSSDYSSTASITIAGVPDQVTGLVGTDGATPKIDWTAPNDNGGAITNYKIYRDTALHDTVGNVLTYTDSTSVVIGTTYDYTVSAVNGMGEGPQSTTVAVTAAVPPDAPTSVDATAVPNQINLTWVTPADDGGSAITGYKIFRTDNLTTAMATLGVVNLWNGDASGTIGVSYTYNVHAINAMGDGPAGVSDTVVHGNVPAQVIVSSVAALLGLAIKIDWDAPVANGYAISSYVVESTVNGGTSWTSVGTPNALTLTHQSLTEANQYQYRVSAVNALGTGTPSATTTPAVTAGDVPSAPSGHSASQSGVAEIGLAWAEPDDHEYSIDEYRIYRSLTTGGTYTLLVDGLTGLTHTDTSLTVSQAYFYKIQAHNSLGWSADSTIVSATAANVPDQVTGMSSQAIAGSDVVLTWNAAGDNSSVVTNYFIEYSLNNATWQTKATVGNVLTYTAQYTPAENGSTYHWRASAINAIGTGAVSTSTNTVIGDVPGQVSGLTATAQSATEIDLSWNIPADNGYAITVYKVERSLDDSNWTTLTSTHTLTTYDDTGLTASTDYYYKITASNVLGIGTASTSVLEKTFGIPNDITDLALTIVNTTQIDLDWSKPAMNGYAFSNYEIWQSEDGTNYSYIGTITNENTTSLSVTGLNINDYYYFYVTTVNAYGTSGDSNIGTAPTLPTPPASVNVAIVNNVALTVSWNQPTGDQQSGYKIERSTDDTNWTTIVADTGNTNTTYADTGLTPLTTYYYKVSTINASGTSAASSSSFNTTNGAPDAPTDLVATSLTQAHIKLDWVTPGDDNGQPITGYKIERGTDGTNFSVLVADTGNVTVTYTDITGIAGTVYYYRISAINTYGAGLPSNIDSALSTDVPAQVTGLSATAQPNFEIDLAWTAPSDGGSTILGYHIERSLDNVAWTDLVVSTGNQNVTYTDINLASGQDYYYRVAAINLVGNGTSSSVVTDQAGDIPDTIIVLSATAEAGNQIEITWTAPDDNDYAITTYSVEVSTDQTNWTTAGGGAPTTFTDTGLTTGTTYHYRVFATNALGNSATSTTVNDLAGDDPDSVTGLTGVALDETRIKLDWVEPGANAYPISGYKIEVSLDNTNWTTVVADTNTTSVIYTHTGLTTVTDYYHRVSAINGLGIGNASTVVQTTTMGVPDAITTLGGTAAVNSINDQRSDITLTWTAPTANGSTISHYTVHVLDTDGVTWLTLQNNVTTTSAIHSNAISDHQFSYRVYATNGIGTSLASNTGLVWTLPTLPNGTAAVATSDTSIQITWVELTNGTTYRIEHSTDNVAWASEANPTTSPYNDTGLTIDTKHYYRVFAVNPGGESPSGTVVNATTFSYPDPPTNLTATPTPTNLLEVNLAWSHPQDTGGDPILNYIVEQSPDNNTWSALPTQCPQAQDCDDAFYVVTVATSNTYYWRVLGENSVGSDSVNGYSLSVTYTSPTPPQSPSNLTVVPVGTSNNQATIDWDAPVNTGTHPITGYKVERQINNGVWNTAIETTNTNTSVTDGSLNVGDVYAYRVYTITQVGYSATFSNTNSIEMLDITFTISGSVIGGNTIAIQPDILYSDGSHVPTVTEIRLFENSAYESDDTNTPQLLTQNITFGADVMYAYPPIESTYFAIATLDNGAIFQVTSNSVVLTPADPFTGNLQFTEVRDATSNWGESELNLEFQPAGSDVIVKYQMEGNVGYNLDTGACISNCPIITGWADVAQAISETTAGLDPDKTYYISIYIQPTFEYPPIQVDGDPVAITCTPSSSTNCQDGNIPKGYPSDIAIKSAASIYAPPSLGIDQLGNLFGMPLVFVFVVGLAAIFTGRSAQMGIIFLAATLGIMAYLGYLSFDFDPDNSSNMVTWTLVIIVAILGVFIGKRWS